ncbi:restriction endonuclease [Kitasatospora phosalacinea]|uniref:restriction endonuclease n=1 Tax=Kitasatospora phosalacinea TaxID=2065 RepID=UPI0035DBB099
MTHPEPPRRRPRRRRRPTRPGRRHRDRVRAKHTENVVSPKVVRALLGTLQDKQAACGVLVTISWYGKSSRETAHRRGQRLDLIDGRNLKTLLPNTSASTP